MNIDRLPPHSIEAEQGVLGCLLTLPDEFVPDAVARLGSSGDALYDVRHQVIYAAIVEMFDRRHTIDLLTVHQWLKDRQQLEAVGGSAYLASLQDKVPSAANLPYYAGIVWEKWIFRKAIQLGSKIVSEAFDGGEQNPPDVEALLSMVEAESLALRDSTSRSGLEPVNIHAQLASQTDDYERLENSGGKPIGLLTGFSEVDQIFGGLEPGQLIILAARPKVGKTSLALNIADNLTVEQGVPVAFFSLEMSARQVMHRRTCSIGLMDGAKIRKGDFSGIPQHKIVHAHSKIASAPMFLYERSGVTVPQIASAARRVISKGVKLLVVDYLGRIASDTKRKSRYEEITAISGQLKDMAQSLKVPVLCLAQLNRAPAEADRPPRMSDLRDSGAIEQDADIIALLHRRSDNGETQEIELDVAGNREGSSGIVRLMFNKAQTRFYQQGRNEP